MTEDETLKIMSMLSAYYGQPKNNAEQMAKAWHMILQHYEYSIAEKAVTEFVISDTRDYGTYPTIGKFCEAIERTKRLPYRIVGKIRSNVKYADLSIIEKTAITEKAYNRAQEMSDIELVDNVNKVVGYIERKMLTEV